MLCSLVGLVTLMCYDEMIATTIVCQSALGAVADVRISTQIRQQLSLTDLLHIKRLAKNASLSLLCFVLALIALMLPDNSRYMVLCITDMTFFEALSWYLDYKLKQEIDKKAVNNDD